MQVTLLINGEQVDFESTMKTLFKQAFSEINTPSLAAASEFVLEPQMAYPVTDLRIQKMFGVVGLVKPAQSIISSLRSVGIDPVKRGRLGSLVFGYQISSYFEALNAQQTSFLHKN
jgi:hypothetical protein